MDLPRVIENAGDPHKATGAPRGPGSPTLHPPRGGASADSLAAGRFDSSPASLRAKRMKATPMGPKEVVKKTAIGPMCFPQLTGLRAHSGEFG